MYYLSKSIVDNLTNNKSSKYSYLSELLALIVVSSIFEESDFVLCDSPDIHSLNSKIGFEVVQCDLDEDLDRYIIYKCFEEEKSIEEFKKYYDIISFNGKVVISSKNNSHSPHYYKKIFEDNFVKKLEKLKKGNYDSCDSVSLIVVSTSREKDNDDAIYIFEIYSNLIKKYEVKFNDVILVTADNIYFLKDKKVCKCDYNEYSRKINKIISDPNKYLVPKE